MEKFGQIIGQELELLKRETLDFKKKEREEFRYLTRNQAACNLNGCFGSIESWTTSKSL
ncbi:MAG: hypothetical protein KDC53_24120 [Saprospiraceae bacterium]|nr:hypothetical protein [Saprospiraceae bacterium]